MQKFNQRGEMEMGGWMIILYLLSRAFNWHV
jgi:hypothetical protein